MLSMSTIALQSVKTVVFHAHHTLSKLQKHASPYCPHWIWSLYIHIRCTVTSAMMLDLTKFKGSVVTGSRSRHEGSFGCQDLSTVLSVNANNVIALSAKALNVRVPSVIGSSVIGSSSIALKYQTPQCQPPQCHIPQCQSPQYHSSQESELLVS